MFIAVFLYCCICAQDIGVCIWTFTLFVHLPWAGPPGRGNWEMSGNGPRPGQTLLTLPEGDGVGDWVGEARGLVSWLLAWTKREKKKEEKYEILWREFCHSHSTCWPLGGCKWTNPCRRMTEFLSYSLDSLDLSHLFTNNISHWSRRPSCVFVCTCGVLSGL